MFPNSIAILGLGLIGASLAKALRNVEPSVYILGYDLNNVCEKALNYKIIDKKLNSFDEALVADLIFLCLPINLSVEIFSKIIPYLNEKQIITDVCSVKGVFKQIWDSQKSNGTFIGGHPMTGKEKGGLENSDPLLFENSVYIITEQNEILINILDKIGARVTVLDPFLHDKVVSVVSHIPQLLAVNLVNFAANCKNDINYIDFAAGGFRDMTRIASSDFNIWRSIFDYNKENIVNNIELFINRLTEIKEAVNNNTHNLLLDEFEKARKHRDEIPKTSKGFLFPLFEIYVYVKDEPGVISKISTALFSNGINIKDIELLKIREGTGGMFRLSFESEKDATKAQEIINLIGFNTK